MNDIKNIRVIIKKLKKEVKFYHNILLKIKKGEKVDYIPFEYNRSEYMKHYYYDTLKRKRQNIQLKKIMNSNTYKDDNDNFIIDFDNF